MSSLLHGFETYPQETPPTPAEVGMMLASMGQMGMEQDPGLGMGGMPGPTTPTGQSSEETAAAPPTPIPGPPSDLIRGVDEKTAWIGSTRHMTPNLADPDAQAWPSAAVAAEDDAAVRGTPWASQQRRGTTPFNDQQLMKLGLSAYEIRLLKLTGGAK